MKGGQLHPARNPWVAPASTRSVATASEHLSATSRRGVLPMRSSSFALTSAPASKSTRMISRCPFSAASCKGVFGNLIEHIRRSAVGEQLSYAGDVSVLNGKMQVRCVGHGVPRVATARPRQFSFNRRRNRPDPSTSERPPEGLVGTFYCEHVKTDRASAPQPCADHSPARIIAADFSCDVIRCASCEWMAHTPAPCQ
jgi:hypothetical protein